MTVFRNILDRLIYNDEYQNIEEGLTDSNVGARKSRNIRDNIFVLSAALNEVLNGDADAVDIQIYALMHYGLKKPLVIFMILD